MWQNRGWIAGWKSGAYFVPLSWIRAGWHHLRGQARGSPRLHNLGAVPSDKRPGAICERPPPSDSSRDAAVP
jgi:hypothetical protein